MPLDEEKFIPEAATRQADSTPCDDDRERRHAARRFFRAAPPYCIDFDTNGGAMLCQKFYEYFPNLAPEEATTWQVISRHQNLEEAERRLRLLCGGPVYYDAEGRPVTKAPRQKPRWDLPPTDDE